MIVSVRDYTTCYWSSEASQKELQRYCLNKMKAIGFNERWKDQTEGMKDKSLAKEILRQGNAFVVGNSKRTGQSPAEMEKVKIRNRDWKINRNELGIILSRQVTATGLVKNKHGVCYLRGMNVVQSYAGDSYVSTPSIEMLGKKTIDCN